MQFCKLIEPRIEKAITVFIHIIDGTASVLLRICHTDSALEVLQDSHAFELLVHFLAPRSKQELLTSLHAKPTNNPTSISGQGVLYIPDLVRALS